MSDLKSRIARLIASQGPLSIAQFMTIALHDPQGGYYSTRDPFGRGGDFITAPEVSQMFGELIGLWCAQTWRDQGAPHRPRLVELGPGRGTMMADALRALQKAPDFLDAIEVVLVEASPTLRAVQAEKLKASGVPIRGVARFDESLIDRPLFLVANEFFDALPIHQYIKTEQGWCERMVTLDSDGSLMFALWPFAALGFDKLAENGAMFETSPAASVLAEEIGGVIATQGGAALIVDYGHDGGFGDTLQAVAKHKFAGVLDAPGEADLSAHVDFAALAAAATRGGAKAFGPIGQGALLDALGLGARAAQLAKANPSEAQSIAAAVDRLTNPAAMGTLFKALAIAPQSAATPPGF